MALRQDRSGHRTGQRRTDLGLDGAIEAYESTRSLEPAGGAGLDLCSTRRQLRNLVHVRGLGRCPAFRKELSNAA